MINKKKILVGIVLYNPNLSRLQQNIDAVAHETDSILLVDNASKNVNKIAIFAKDKKIKLICNTENKGLPRVFNSMISYAQENGFENELEGMEETFEDISGTLISSLESNRFKGFEIVK